MGVIILSHLIQIQLIVLTYLDIVDTIMIWKMNKGLIMNSKLKLLLILPIVGTFIVKIIGDCLSKKFNNKSNSHWTEFCLITLIAFILLGLLTVLHEIDIIENKCVIMFWQ